MLLWNIEQLAPWDPSLEAKSPNEIDTESKEIKGKTVENPVFHDFLAIVLGDKMRDKYF